MERTGESARGGFEEKTWGISARDATEIQSITKGRWDVIYEPCHCQLQIAECSRRHAEYFSGC